MLALTDCGFHGNFLLSICSTDKTVAFQDFVYLSQVVQGLCIRAEAEHYRRYISEPDIMTRGTLYWQLASVILG